MNSVEINRLMQMKKDSSAVYPEVQAALEQMEKTLTALCAGGTPMHDDVRRIISAGGKRLRPALAFLSYRMGGSAGQEIVPLMCMLELMHTASLIHDDVVDGAALRRGCATINITSGDNTAVQGGDYLLAKAMEILPVYKGTGINEELAHISTQMCLGELQQQKNRYLPDGLTKDGYFLQIHRKTAGLLSGSCHTGAVAGGMPEPQAEKLAEYGALLGIAFQLRDDLLDFSPGHAFGKMPGQDLMNGIFTFPAIIALERGMPDNLKALLVKREKNRREIFKLIDFVKSTGALEYTEFLIRRKSLGAIDILNDFPESAEKNTLVELAGALAVRRE